MEYGLRTKQKKQFIFAIYTGFMFVSAIVSMQIATQYVAENLHYQKALGNSLFIVFDTPIYPFWNIFTWDSTNVRDIFDDGIMRGQFAFLIPQAIFIALILFFFRPKGNKKLHGTARWATEKEIKDMGYLERTGVYVGAYQSKNSEEVKYLRHNGAEHILCIAPTRSGKGVGLILPTLLSWQNSSLVLDIKGENWALTAGYRKSLGHKVLRFDPTDTTGSSCTFNPIDEIRLCSLYAVQDVQNMAMMIIDSDGKGLPDYWTKAAFAFFSGLILHCCIVIRAKYKRSTNLQDIVLMMSGYQYDEGIKTLLQEMVQLDHTQTLQGISSETTTKIGLEIHAFIASSAMEMQNKAPAEVSGVLSTALSNMALYRDPIVTLNTSKSDFKIADLMNHDVPVDLYLVLSPDNIDRMRPLIRLILDMIVRRICREMVFKDGASVQGYKHRLLFMLDEFTSLGKIPIMEKAIAYIASYGGKMYLIVQDVTQLNGAYGKENALMANCHIRIAYAPNTIETAKILSDMTGKTTVVDRKISISYSKSGRSTSESISETARALLTPDECMRLPSAIKNTQGNVVKAGDMLIFTAGQNPIYGMQILYFKDPIFMERAKTPVPYLSHEFSNGVTDSIYFPRACTLNIAKASKNNFENYLKDAI